MAKKVNFAMANQDTVNKVQLTADIIFAHAMEQTALGKAKKQAQIIVDNAVKADYNGEIALLRDAIRTDESKVDANVVEALRTLGRIEYKRAALRTWFKDAMTSATTMLRLDDIIEELGDANSTLEKGVEKVDAILTEIFGLEKVAVATRRKFSRRVYSAMDGQKKSAYGATVKGKLLSERSRQEIKEIGIRAMCEYMAKTTNISLKTREDYTVVVEYDQLYTTVTNFKCEEVAE